jgi:DNA-binding CsgD family transcriptional regulator
MEYVRLILADLYPLSRLGLTTLLNRMRYRFQVKEVVSPEKLGNLGAKDAGCLFFVTSSFLIKCPSCLLGELKSKTRPAAFVLIRDREDGPDSGIVFSETIQMTDSDKIILRKLEKITALVRRQTADEPLNEDLSDREKDILRLVALGMTNREIGEKLYISTHTVITHRKNITAKLGIKTIAGLTMYALINQLIVPEEIHLNHD